MTATYGDWAESLEELVTYRYLASRPKALDRDHAENWLRLRHDLRSRTGILASPLAIAMLDAAGVNVDPINVLALTHIDIDVLDPARDVPEVHVRSHVTREARTQVFTEATITAAADPSRVIAFGTANWSVIMPTSGDFRYPEPGVGIPDSPDAPPLWQAYTGRRRSDGRIEIPDLAPKVGTLRLHHGPMLVVSEAVALEAAQRLIDDGAVRVEHLATSIVNPGRVGPFVATPEAFATAGGTFGCRVELRDEGKDGRLVARTFVRICRARG